MAPPSAVGEDRVGRPHRLACAVRRGCAGARARRSASCDSSSLGAAASISSSSNRSRSSSRSRAPASSPSSRARTSSARTCSYRPRHPSSELKLLGTAVGVEHLELRGRQHQLAMLVLAVEGQQPAPELPQVGHRRRAPAHIRAGPSVGPHAPGEDELLGTIRNRLGAGKLRGQREHTFDICLGGAGPDDPAAGPPAEQQIERVSQQRLAGSGLAGHDVQPRSEAELGSIQQQQVLDAQLKEHGATCYQEPTTDRYGVVAKRPNLSRSRL